MKHKVQFLKSAVFPKDYPEQTRPELAIVGRSNAGKSSLVNTWTGTQIAKVSQTPGKTRLINFFDVGEHYRLVDLPGYGWAARDLKEMEMWTKMIEAYLAERDCLSVVLLVMDCRRDWSKDEAMLKSYLDRVGLPLVVVLTKVDKLSKNEAAQRLKIIKEQAAVSHIYMTSAIKNLGVDELEESVFNTFIKEEPSVTE